MLATASSTFTVYFKAMLDLVLILILGFVSVSSCMFHTAGLPTPPPHSALVSSCMIFFSMMFHTAGLPTPPPHSALAQKPKLKVITKKITPLCSKGVISVGYFATFEVQLSGNNSNYTYDEFGPPSFREWDLAMVKGKPHRTGDRDICNPFHTVEGEFCVKKEIADTKNVSCSCEEISKDVYRVKLGYKFTENSSVSLGLQWDCKSGGPNDHLIEFFDLPAQTTTQLPTHSAQSTTQTPTHPVQDASNSEVTSTCSGWCVWGIISIIIIIVMIVVSFLARYHGYVSISFTRADDV